MIRYLKQYKLLLFLTVLFTAISSLSYVFIAILPYAAHPKPYAELNPVDAVMRMDRIFDGFVAWFGDGAFLWVVLVFMLILSLVFITFPLLTGILAVSKEKALGFKKGGGFGLIPLPVVAKQRAEQEANTEITEK